MLNAVDVLTNATTKVPEFNNSWIAIGGYSTQGVKAFPSNRSAYPHREDSLLVAPFVSYKTNPKLGLLEGTGS
jgi:hypothetical protein